MGNSGENTELEREIILRQLNFDFRRYDVYATYSTRITKRELAQYFLDYLRFAIDEYQTNRLCPPFMKARNQFYGMCVISTHYVLNLKVTPSTRVIVKEAIISTLVKYYQQTGEDTTYVGHFFFGYNVPMSTFAETRIKFLQSILKCYE